MMKTIQMAIKLHCCCIALALFGNTYQTKISKTDKMSEDFTGAFAFFMHVQVHSCHRMTGLVGEFICKIYIHRQYLDVKIMHNKKWF